VNIFLLVEADHRTQRSLADRLRDSATPSEDRRALLEELYGEVEAHAAAEEQTLYAEFLADPVARIPEHVEHHDRFGDLLLDLREMECGSAQWNKKLELFTAALERHLNAEEADLIPLGRRVLSEDRCEALGNHFERRKRRELSLWGHTPAGDPDPPRTGSLAAVHRKEDEAAQPVQQEAKAGGSSANASGTRPRKSVISSRSSRAAASQRITRIS
jgi:hypothetical protein